MKDWGYIQEIQGKENIVDLASRVCKLNTLDFTKKWFNGREWLLYNKEKWPKKDLGQNEDKDKEADVEETQRDNGTAVYFSEIESKIKSKDFRIESVMDLKQFSNFYKLLSPVSCLLSITVYVLRFIGNCRNKLRQESPDITIKEINKAQ